MRKDEWQRARSSEQIEERVNAILEAAAAVFRSLPYEKVSLLTIAKKAGFTRSNIYRYFSTKEEIFLALYLADLEEWKNRLRTEFTAPMSIEDFALLWTRILMDHPRLLELTPLFAISLEKNTSEATYRKTKLHMAEFSGEVIEIMEYALPDYDKEQLYAFLSTQQMLVAGAWPMSRYTDMQRKVITDLSLENLCIDFAPFFINIVTVFLKGLRPRPINHFNRDADPTD